MSIQALFFLSTCQEKGIFACTKCHFMKVMSVGEFKKIVARLVPKLAIKKTKRKLGILEGKCKVKFGADFKMTEEEFLGV